MKKEFNNKLSMAKVVLNFIEIQNPTIINTPPSLPNEVAQLKTTINKIGNLNKFQTMNRLGHTINKKKAREEMTNYALNCALALMAATQTLSDQTLYNEVKTTRTSLNRLRDNQVNIRCQFLLRRALEHQQTIETFGITTEILQKFSLSIEYHNEQIAKPRLSIVERVQLTNKIKKEFKNLSLLFTKIDTNINALSFLYPQFVNEYKTCRITINYRSKSLALSGYIKDQTGKPIYGAVCSLTDLNRETKTTTKGKFEFKKIATGNYLLQAKRPGHITITQTVSIVRGKTNKLNLVMPTEIGILNVA